MAQESIVKHLGTLRAANKAGVEKQVNICIYHNQLRLDISRWKMGKPTFRGISLTEDEVRRLRYILEKIDFGILE
ncbi:MAG: hypothetical protein ACLTY9_05085 [Oscillospiraceae bacterium]|nr:hypothetical protein [Oscillospiraceae bacterium]